MISASRRSTIEPDDMRSGAPQLRLAAVSASRDLLETAGDWLTDEEKERAQRFVMPADRARFALGRILIRTILRDEFGVDRPESAFVIDATGRPLLPDRPDIGFSIAHSGDLVLVGAGLRVDVGVDVERRREDFDLVGVARMIMSADELGWVLRGPAEERVARFFRHWAMKEALVKALGTGLMRDPRRFAVRPSAVPDVVFVGPGADDVGSGWILEEIAVPSGYSASMAWRRR